MGLRRAAYEDALVVFDKDMALPISLGDLANIHELTTADGFVRRNGVKE